MRDNFAPSGRFSFSFILAKYVLWKHLFFLLLLIGINERRDGGMQVVEREIN